jgi:hypothetical protein
MSRDQLGTHYLRALTPTLPTTYLPLPILRIHFTQRTDHLLHSHIVSNVYYTKITSITQYSVSITHLLLQ